MNPWIEVINLTKIYSDGTKALDDLTFSCKAPLVALVGPNGAGKTTFVRIATGLIRPTKGVVKVVGFDVVSESSKIKDMVALLPQDAIPDPNMKPIDVVSYYLALRGYSKRDAVRRAKEALEFVGLDKVAYTKCANLSIGMKKLVLVAAILAVEDVEALFLDEPTAGLDPINRIRLCSAIQHRVRRDGVRVLLTSHNMNEVEQLADEVLMINNGRLVIKGSPSILINKLSKFVRIELPCRDLEKVSQVLSIVKTVRLGGELCLVYVYKDSLSDLYSIVNELSQYPIIKKITLEDVFVWYAK